MRHRFTVPLLALLISLAALLAGCSRDPNVRKQKYLESGERYFDKGQYPHAAIQFANALQVDPRYAEAHYRLSQVYLKTQDWSRAYRELSRTLQLQPTNYAARLDIANLLLDSGQPAQAQEHVDFLVAHDPTDAQVVVVLAKLHTANGDLAKATQDLQRAISLAPTEYESYLDLGQLQLRTDQSVAAELSFEKAVELAPASSTAHLALGSYYQSQRRFPDAERQFRIAMQVAPSALEPRSALVRLYTGQNNVPAAVALLQQTKIDLAKNSSAYRMLGDFYFAISDYDKSLAEYESLYSEHPNDLQVKKNYIQLLIVKGRFDDARKLNDEVLKSTPTDADCLIYRGQIQTHDGQVSDAVATLERVTHSDPNNAAAYFHLGNAYAQAGNLREAKGAWSSAVRLRPDLIDAARALAATALRENDMETLSRVATQIVNGQSTLPDGYALRALSFTSRGLFADAESDAAKAVELAPAQPAGYIQMGNLRMAQKRYREAEQYFQLALSKDSSSSDALQSLVQVYLLQKQPAKALAAVENQIAKIPANNAFYYLLGNLLSGEKDYSGAQKAFQKSVELNRNNVSAWLQLVRTQESLNMTSEAVSNCELASQENPRDPSLLILLGQLYDQEKQTDNSENAYRQALQIAPDNPVASNNLAYSMLENGGNPDIALSLAQAAQRGMPDSYSAADTLGWAYYQKGAYGSAIDSFQHSLKLAEEHKQQDDPAVHFHLGLAYAKSGQPLQARQELQETLRLNPNYAKAGEVRKLLLQTE